MVLVENATETTPGVKALVLARGQISFFPAAKSHFWSLVTCGLEHGSLTFACSGWFRWR